MLNFDPVCPVHQTEMVRATHWVKIDGKSFPKPIFVCTQTDCVHAFDLATQSYSEIPQNAPVGQPIDDVLSRFKLL